MGFVTLHDRSIGSMRAGRSAHTSFSSRYFTFLVLMLAGYAIIGKGFAYIGVPPLYIGEIGLISGAIAAMASGCLLASFATIPSILLLILISMVTIRCLLGSSVYGIDSLRDGVIVIYGAYAFIVAALLIDRPERIELVIGYYRRFSLAMLIAAPLVLSASSFFNGKLPIWPNSGVPLVFVRTGELAVHLAGITVFTLLGFRRLNAAFALLLLISAALVVAQNRGGMLAFAIPTLIAMFLAQNRMQIVKLALFAALFILVVLILNIKIEIGGGRNLDINQAVANVVSVFGSSSTGNLDGTKEWRLRWWSAIIDYTFKGDYFWQGKGFGMGLAEADGFIVGAEGDGPMVRSPHNAHMTILARLGVPGLIVWLTFLTCWFTMMARNARAAFRQHEDTWARMFVFIALYVLSAIIDSTFDVALEGPMLGIWFWVLIGTGIGMSTVYWSTRPWQSSLRTA
uniref:O-antigen polymerase n=1 Tax=Rhodopseudomonas palustris (strain BisA53) TaxID=316055 RepID=Q07KV3_RHOP5